MMPPAPPLLSTTTVWPSSRERGSISRRAVRSTPPPGGKGTMILMGRSGKLWAPARRAAARTGNAAAATSRLLRLLRKTKHLSAPPADLDRAGVAVQTLNQFVNYNRKAIDDEDAPSRRLPLRRGALRMPARSGRRHEPLQLF